VGTWLWGDNGSKQINDAHALTQPRQLHYAGVDVLVPGLAKQHSMVQVAAAAAAPALVRWLAAEVCAPLDEMTTRGDTPLMVACIQSSWTAARALLSCGARV
jgi:hypothetical protein